MTRKSVHWTEFIPPIFGGLLIFTSIFVILPGGPEVLKDETGVVVGTVIWLAAVVITFAIGSVFLYKGIQEISKALRFC